MAHKELDLRERRRIEDLLNAKLPVSTIAAEIGRHRSTVYREIKRNAFAADTEEVAYLDGYYGMVAQRKAADRRARSSCHGRTCRPSSEPKRGFCDPSSPWQKGAVENTNRRLRRWLPRQRDVAAMTELEGARYPQVRLPLENRWLSSGESLPWERFTRT